MSTRFSSFVQVDPGQERVEVDAVEHGVEIHDLHRLLHDDPCQLEQRHHRVLRGFGAVVDRGLDEAPHRGADELDDRGAGGNDALGGTDVGRPDHELHHRAGEPARGTNGVRRVGHRGRLDLGRDFRRDRHERRPLFAGLHAHTIGRVAAFPPFREVRCVQFATAASVVHDIARPGRRGNPCKTWSSSKCAAAASSRSSA